MIRKESASTRVFREFVEGFTLGILGGAWKATNFDDKG